MNSRLGHEELVELLAVYALDAVDPDEAADIEAHLPSCPRCASELADQREAAALLATDAGPAPQGMWPGIARQLDRPAAPLPAQPATPGGRGDSIAPRRHPLASRWAVLAILAAAAVVVLVTVAGLRIGDQEQRLSHLEVAAAPTPRDVAEAALSDPGSRPLDLRGGDGTRVLGVLDRAGVGYLFAESLPRISPERTYQLWAVDGHGRRLSLGLLGSSPTMVTFTAAEPLEALAITNEPAGGVPTTDRPPVVAGTLT